MNVTLPPPPLPIAGLLCCGDKTTRGVRSTRHHDVYLSTTGLTHLCTFSSRGRNRDIHKWETEILLSTADLLNLNPTEF